MAAREENILNVPLSETLEGMHVLCDTGSTGEPYRVAASLFIAEATQAAKDAVANLDPKDVILKGFTALTAGKPAITANSTLLAAIQSLYAMAGSGKVKIISDGADQTGMVCWNGTSASGFVINVNEAAIYTRSQWTQSNPDSVTDANWIAAVKTGGAKNPFNALNTLLTGWVNRSIKKPTITSTDTIFDALKALYWASGNGTVLNISNGGNRFGFVGWNENTAYGFMLDTATFTIYIRQWAQDMATSNANTAALWREAIQGGEAFSLKQPLNIYIHPGTSSVPLADLATVKEADVFIYTVGDNRALFLKSELYDNEVVFNSVTALASEWSDRNNPPEVHFMSIKINLTTGDLTPDVVPVFLPSWLKIEGTPIQVNDFKTIVGLDKFQGMRDGELVGFFSSSGGGASGPGVNPVLGYIQRASASQANILAYNMGATKAWIGYATSAATKWTELGGGGNVLHGNDITEGLEYLVPENVGDVVAFRSTMDSAQVPAEQEGFGFLAKVNGSESMAMMMQNDPAGGGKMKFFMGRVQNDGSGTEWQELTTGSSTGTARSLSRVEINDFGDYDTLHAILEQSGDMVAIYADYPDNDPVEGGSYIGTAQFDNDYADAIVFTVLNTQTNTYYQGYVRPTGVIEWDGAWGGVKETISIDDFSPAALFSAPYNFHLYPSGTMIPIEGNQQAEQGPFPASIYETAGYIMVQYGNNHTSSALRQVMVVLHEVGTIAGQPGRMAYATIAKSGLSPRWQIIGDSQWLWTGDRALTVNTTASLPLNDYTIRTGDRLEIYYAYLGGGTEGHIMGFNNAVSVLYNPTETLTQSFFTLVTSGGSASQLEAQFEFRMMNGNLQIIGRNLGTGGVDVVSQFRIKGVKLVR